MRYILKKVAIRRARQPFTAFYDRLFFRYHILFFGSLIFNGFKLRAFNFFLSIKRGLKTIEGTDPAQAFLVGLMNASPSIHLLTIKLGGRPTGVPLPITETKRVSLGVKFILQTIRQKFKVLGLAHVVDTLVSSIHGAGLAIDRKKSLYKTGRLNRHLIYKVFRFPKKDPDYQRRDFVKPNR